MKNRQVAVLVDTTSIQQYIFSGNRLKENLGASYLVKSLIDSKSDLLNQALKKVAPLHPGVDSWLNNADKDSSAKVGYIGGGNALFLFEGTTEILPETQAKQFIHELSRLLLIHAPGLRTAFGIASYDEHYQDSMKRLHDDLKANKRRLFPQTIIMKHGITAECPNSGESVESDRSEKKGSPLISAVSKARLDAAKASHTALCKLVADKLGTDYTFPEELDQLGQQDTRSYIAVVHIDGNGVGQRFRECENLDKARDLSAKVTRVGIMALNRVTEDVINIVKLAAY